MALITIMVVIFMEAIVLLLISQLNGGLDLRRLQKVSSVFHLHQDLKLRHHEQGVLFELRLKWASGSDRSVTLGRLVHLPFAPSI